MGIQTIPAPSAGGIKSVQRGSAGGAGNVTITAVDINKAFVTVFGTASSGTVAATGAIGATNGTSSAASGTLGALNIFRYNQGGGGASATTAAFNPTSGLATDGLTGGVNATAFNTNAQNVALNATNITGGSNNLVAAVIQGFLANSTTLTVSGACRWEVVEFN
jgi:hypothetical protein